MPDPDERAILQHLEAIAAPAVGTPLGDGLLEIAYGQIKPDKARLFPLADLHLATEFAARVNRAGHHCYVGMSLRKPATHPGKRTSKASFYGSHYAWMDDAKDWRTAKAAAIDCPPDLTVCTGKTPVWRGQALRRFREPITDPVYLETLNRAIQDRLGGDDVSNRDRVMRLAGTVNWPTKPGRIVPELVTMRWTNGVGSFTDLEAARRTYVTARTATGPQPAPAGPRSIFGQVDLEKAILEAAKPGKWHSNVRDTVAHLVGRRAPDDLIHAICQRFTMPGFSAEQTRDDVEKLIAGARTKWGEETFDQVDQPAQPEQPLPLTRDLPPPAPFPIDCLGKTLADAARGIQDIIQAPLAMCGQSVLGAAALAAQAHVDVMLPTNQVRPVSLYLLSVAATGDRKSACDREALSPVRQHERNLHLLFEKQLIGWRDRVDLWKAERDKILKSKAPMLAKQADLAALGPQPPRPLDPVVVSAEPTVEGLIKLLARGQPSVGVFSAEGGMFIGSFAMGKEQQLRTATAYSEFWDGEIFKRIRAGEDTLILPGRRVSVHLMVQPDVAALLLGDRMLIEQGMLSRILISAPDSLAGSRLWHEPKPVSDMAVSTYSAALMTLFDDPPPLTPGTINELAPRELLLSARARSSWITFADDVERQMGPSGDYESIRGLANKLAEHAARIAAVLTVVEQPKTNEIAVEQMEAGVELARYYGAKSLRLLGVVSDDPELLLAQRTLEWLRTQSGPISLRDVYRNGPQAIRNAKVASKIMVLLEEHGHVRRDGNTWTVVSP